jgi:mono/diheme cytochrome c family protein
MSKNKFYGATLLFTALCTASFAGIEDGQKLYLKSCKACHGNAVKGAAMATQSEWDKWFANGASALIEKHKNDAKSASYFNGPAFKTQIQDLHEFLKEYGSDSGNVPACG